MPKLEGKSALFGDLWATILNFFFHISNQHPQICLFAKFCETMKMPQFNNKSALYACFWA